MVTPSRRVDEALEAFKEAFRTIGVHPGDLTLKKQGRRYVVELQSAGSARVTRQWGNDAHTLRSRWFFSSTPPRP